jgi:eukaryotic-like serine/threonine-protein kinase
LGSASSRSNGASRNEGRGGGCVPQHGCPFGFDKGPARKMEKVSSGKIGKYEIIKVLGRGGMGEVLLAEDVDLGRRVAIKRPFKSALEDGLARFQVEAKAATLRHPNIPAIYEMGVADGLPFIAMEFVEGEPLDRIIDSGKQLDLITKLSIIEQVCSALGYAHENGIIHRDIKPPNVIVQLDKDKGRLIVAKIIDFGIAKIQDEEGKPGLTQTSAVIGSLHYIAPERFRGGTIDGRVDIFSAGVTLFKLLTGHEPFTGGEATASYKIVNEAHTPLGTYIHDYPPALDEIVAKSLAKNPEDRYSTGEDFADALHEVIEDLKRNRVSELFNDAERLTTESRFTPALELLEEAIKLDPANTQVRKLRKFVREHQERIKRAERLRECVARADEALLTGNFEEALTQLREAQNMDASSAEVKDRIQSAEARKRRYEVTGRALSDAEAAKTRGDINAALRIISKACQDDPENQKLLAVHGVLARQAELEAQRGKVLELLERARAELATRNLAAADKLLTEAENLDPSNLETEALRREYAKVREQEQRREILNEIRERVNDFIRAESLDQAADLVNRAIEKLPNEPFLHRLKAEVDAEAGKLEAKRYVETAISQAKELFATSPFEALAILQKALEQMPGEERLVSYERSLRQQLDSLRVEQVRADTLIKAQELVNAKQLDKAIGVLESFQIEFGQHTEIVDLLTFARDQQAKLRRSTTVERCTSESRALIRDGRLEDAVRLLEQGIQETGDASLSRLLEELREQQVAFARKIETLEKRVGLLRERGELDEALHLLQEQLAAMPGNPAFQQLLSALKAEQEQKQQVAIARQIELLEKRVGQLRERGELDEAIHLLQEQLNAAPGNQPLQELLTALKAEQEQKQVTAKAIAAAREATGKKDFSAALQSLQAVLRAYGDSAELAAAMQEVQNERAAHAHEIVGKSIESARAALLKNDPQGALAALKGSTQWMEFADVKRQADWQRIGQSVKKALEQSGTTVSSGAAFDEQLSAIAAARPKKFPAWAIATAGLVVVAIVAIVIWKLQPPPVSTVAHIKIAKAPPGASVSIDNAPAVLADANGEVTVQVKPGSHQLQVTKEGFEPFTDKADVSPGGTYQDAVSLTKLLPAGTSGTLAPQGNLPEFKVAVDGKNMGVHRAGQLIDLPIGSHTVRYTAPDDSSFQEHPVQIALNQSTTDSFFLKPPKPQNTLTTQAAAKQAPAPQTQTQQAPAQPVPVAPPLPLTGSLKVNTNSIEKGSSVQLAWEVSNASTVSISNYGEGLGSHGSAPVYPTATTTYELVANGTSLGKQTVTVNEPKPQPQAVTPPPVVNTPARPAGPDLAALTPALNTYEGLFVQASGKSSKECQSILSGKYQGKLHDLAQGWCDAAKRFEAREQGCQVGGSAEAPTLTCAETLIVYPKDGDPKPFKSQKTFRLSGKPEGPWQISGW